jgi:hypothetical protein
MDFYELQRELCVQRKRDTATTAAMTPVNARGPTGSGVGGSWSLLGWSERSFDVLTHGSYSSSRPPALIVAVPKSAPAAAGGAPQPAQQQHPHSAVLDRDNYHYDSALARSAGLSADLTVARTHLSVSRWAQFSVPQLSSHFDGAHFPRHVWSLLLKAHSVHHPYIGRETAPYLMPFRDANFRSFVDCRDRHRPRL